MDSKTLAAALNDAGHRTAHGLPFDTVSAGNLRTYRNISYPELLADGELTPAQAASRTGVSPQTIRYWITHGYLTARRGPAGHYAIPFPPEVEAACRQRASNSGHQHHDITAQPRRDHEYTIAEAAARLGTGKHRIYSWIKQGILPARRGPGARLWTTLTPENEAHCRHIIANSRTSTLKPSHP